MKAAIEADQHSSVDVVPQVTVWTDEHGDVRPPAGLSASGDSAPRCVMLRVARMWQRAVTPTDPPPGPRRPSCDEHNHPKSSPQERRRCSGGPVP
jgi:hypothetical protein